MLQELLTGPLSFFLMPEKRLFWVFLASSLLLASLAVTLQQGKLDIRQQLKALFNKAYWINQSTLVDTGLMFTNHFIRVLLLVPMAGSYLGATLVVTRFLQDNLGDAPDIEMSLWLITCCFTVSFFIVEDFSRFILHYLMHKLPFLWHFHKTHHSATNLTPLTLHRIHPVESILYFFRGMLVFAILSGVFIYLFQGKLSAWQILGVDLFGFLFNIMGANLRHTPIWLGFGKLEYVFISPAQHQIHHSADIMHRDKNFGTCLAIWDHIAGSWLLSGKRRKLTFGIASPTNPKPVTGCENPVAPGLS